MAVETALVSVNDRCVHKMSWKLLYFFQHFVIFVLLRAVVGIGEGCYSTIAPTIIADLFADDTRTTAISIFYIAIPVGRSVKLHIVCESEITSHHITLWNVSKTFEWSDCWLIYFQVPGQFVSEITLKICHRFMNLGHKVFRIVFFRKNGIRNNFCMWLCA